MTNLALLHAFISLLAVVTAAPWDAYNLSSRSRIISVESAFPVTLTPLSPSALFDFGKEVGGGLMFSVGEVGGSNARLSFTFSESLYYTDNSDNSHGGSGNDGAFSKQLRMIVTQCLWAAVNTRKKGFEV